MQTIWDKGLGARGDRGPGHNGTTHSGEAGGLTTDTHKSAQHEVNEEVLLATSRTQVILNFLPPTPSLLPPSVLNPLFMCGHNGAG